MRGRSPPKTQWWAQGATTFHSTQIYYAETAKIFKLTESCKLLGTRIFLICIWNRSEIEPMHIEKLKIGFVQLKKWFEYQWEICLVISILGKSLILSHPVNYNVVRWKHHPCIAICIHCHNERRKLQFVFKNNSPEVYSSQKPQRYPTQRCYS